MTGARRHTVIVMVDLRGDDVIDLHTHSTCSDGTDRPADVVRAAAGAGLTVLALTDHDVVSGWAAADSAAQELGLLLVPGIEVSCAWQGISVHLLAYLPDPADPGLTAEMTASRNSRERRLERMVELLAADGYPISYEQVLEGVEPGATLGRPHVADALVRSGVVGHRNDAFVELLDPAGPYYVAHYAPDPVTATGLVVAAGGVPVMAHPFASSRGRVVPETLIEQMADAGLVGLEVDHVDHGPAELRRAREVAHRLGLLTTGSSDYHGTGKTVPIGAHTTAPEVLEQILRRARGMPLLGGR